MHKGEPNKISKCRIKINLDVTNFQANKSTAQIWVVTHIISMDSLGSFLGCHVKWGGGGGKGVGGRGGSQLWRREMSPFLFLWLPVLRFASIRTKPSLCVKDQRNINLKSFSLGMILSSQM